MQPMQETELNKKTQVMNVVRNNGAWKYKPKGEWIGFKSILDPN